MLNSLLSWADFKQSKELKKTDGTKRQRITGIPKLEDANDAGGKNSEKCTLILTEGDSAKALAVSYISVIYMYCLLHISKYLNLPQTQINTI
jgi:DNA topoisomerase II